MKNTQYNKNITIYSADIFDTITNILKNEASKHIIVPNICFAMNKSVSGFSKELYKYYPSVMADVDINSVPKNLCSYSIAYKNHQTKAQLIVAHMYCHGNKSKHRPLHYGQLVFCMYEIKKLISNLKQQFPDFVTEIHCSKFGVGSSGGNWSMISDLISDIWNEEKVFVYNNPRKVTHNAY